MFSDITREDVFRLETRRLWLRWPMVQDAADWAETAGTAHLLETASGDPHRREAALLQIARWRRDNESGRALHLVATGRGADRRPLGMVGLTPLGAGDCGLLLRIFVAPARRRTGHATEAVQAVVDSTFMLSTTTVVAASARVLDPAFRRVLEKCGFTYCGTGLDDAPEGAGLVASDRFRLDRKTWVSLKLWRGPGMVRRQDDADSGLCHSA